MNKQGIIAKIEDDSYQGKDFKKVTLINGDVLKVKYGREGHLKAKWGELEVRKAFEFEMGEYNGKPFVQDFHVLSSEQAHEIQTHPQKPEQVIAPQEKGMWWKEVGENFRVGLFKKDDTEGNGSTLWRHYVTQMLTSLEIKIEKGEGK